MHFDGSTGWSSNHPLECIFMHVELVEYLAVLANLLFTGKALSSFAPFMARASFWPVSACAVGEKFRRLVYRCEV